MTKTVNLRNELMDMAAFAIAWLAAFATLAVMGPGTEPYVRIPIMAIVVGVVYLGLSTVMVR